jgi:PIN domain
MKSVTELVNDLSSGITNTAKELFFTHSRLASEERGRSVAFLDGNHCWESLSVEGSRLQSKLRDDFERYHSLMACFLRTQGSSVQNELQESYSTIKDLIDQDALTYISSEAEAFKRFEDAIGLQRKMLDALYDHAEGEHVYVPDTNAMVFNPQLEDWRFDESPCFTLLLMPTVLSELDQLKVTGRVESVRDKAQKIVRQLLEYRRRGSLNEGIVLRKDSHRLRTLAVEPDFRNSLPWLDPNNNDDRILAGFVEAMRQHPRSPTILVTGDINLTNKADYARIPCVPPPDPPKPGSS